MVQFIFENLSHEFVIVLTATGAGVTNFDNTTKHPGLLILTYSVVHVPRDSSSLHFQKRRMFLRKYNKSKYKKAI